MLPVEDSLEERRTGPVSSGSALLARLVARDVRLLLDPVADVVFLRPPAAEGGNGASSSASSSRSSPPACSRDKSPFCEYSSSSYKVPGMLRRMSSTLVSGLIVRFRLFFVFVFERRVRAEMDSSAAGVMRFADLGLSKSCVLSSSEKNAPGTLILADEERVFRIRCGDEGLGRGSLFDEVGLPNIENPKSSRSLAADCSPSSPFTE